MDGAISLDDGIKGMSIEDFKGLTSGASVKEVRRRGTSKVDIEEWLRKWSVEVQMKQAFSRKAQMMNFEMSLSLEVMSENCYHWTDNWAPVWLWLAVSVASLIGVREIGDK